MRRLLLAILACSAVVVAALFAGPVASGAVLLLLPNHGEAADHQLPESYKPLHKGHIDLATGLYIREDEDLVVRGTPALILRRTYLSGYRVSTDFGIGTTHDGEWYLTGNAERAALIHADGSRINFDRVSPGMSFFNATYEHRTTPGAWQGARLDRTGVRWTIRRRDGSVMLFQICGPGTWRTCSIVESRDPDGHVIHYRRDASGRLLRMEAAPDRWIGFEYDAQNRITRAFDHAGREVRYEYDDRGRLSRVAGTEGRIHRYSYTDRDEMATIVDPGTTIENSYDANGRCIRQVNRFPDEPDPFIFEFTYRTDGDAVIQTDTKRSDGTWSRYTFGKGRYPTSETWGRAASESAAFTYDRDPTTNIVTALTVTCPDRTGQPLRHSSLVRPGHEERIKWDIVETHCYWWAKHSRAPKDKDKAP